MKIKNKRLLGWVVFIFFALTIPLLGSLFTDEMQWSVFDYLLMGAGLSGIAGIYEWMVQKSEKSVYRFAVGLGILGSILLFWVNGAVGIIGHEGQKANLLYGLVFLTLIIGVLISRFNSRGMSITFFLAAMVTIVVPGLALIIWPPSTISWSPGIIGVFLLSGFFALFFFISGILFRQVSR